MLLNDFGDENDHHGFWVIDTNKRWDMELIHLPYPEFMTLSSSDIKKYTKEELEYNYVRVQATAKEVDKVQKDLEDAGEVRIEVEKEYSKNSRSGISVTMSHEEIIKTYVNEACENDKSLQSEPLVKKGVEIMKKVIGLE